VKAKFLFLFAAALLAGTAALAQFDMLNKIKDAVTNKGNTTTNNKSTTDTLNAAGQMLKGVAGIGPDEEKVIGDSVALEIVGKYGGLIRDAATLRRVNLVGRALSRYADGRELNWRFGVLNSDSVNAFSAPDGWVFITRGLYNLAKNDDALAGILGHEIAHVTGRHALKIVEGSNILAGGVGIVASRSNDVRTVDAQLKNLGLSVGKITSTLFENGYSPDTEFQADQNGHNLAKVTGYAPGGLRGVLSYLQQRGGDSKATFSTHPPLRDRIKRLPDEPAPKL
jgi:predicted Zn-dependent protease